jgi:hypothetical protein
MSSKVAQNDSESSSFARSKLVLQSAYAHTKATINQNLPPETRQRLQQEAVLYARSHPIIASLVFSQLVFSGVPLLFFLGLSAGIFIFSLVAALVLSLLGVLMITLGCMCLGSLILVPTLFVTTLTAGGIWGWGWGLYYLVQWVGSGDTALLTRLSILLLPQRPQNQCGSAIRSKSLDGSQLESTRAGPEINGIREHQTSKDDAYSEE